MADDSARDDFEEDDDWFGVCLAEVVRREAEPPTRFQRVDGVGLIPDGARVGLYGEPGSGKSFLAALEALSTSRRGGAVLYVDAESDKESVLERFLALGATNEDLVNITYLSPPDPVTSGNRQAEWDLQMDRDLVIFDGLTKLMALHGFDVNENRHAAAFFTLLVDPATRSGATVIVVAHVAKDSRGRGRWALGAQHIVAELDVAFAVEKRHSWGRGLDGDAVLILAKEDRTGFLAALTDDRARIAEAEFTSQPDGHLDIALHAPGWAAARGSHEDGEELGRAMEELSRYIEDASDEGRSTRALRDGAVTGISRELKKTAVGALEAGGFIEITPGPKNARIHRSLRPFRHGIQDTPASAVQRGMSVEGHGQEVRGCVGGSIDPTHAPHTRDLTSDDHRGEIADPRVA